MPLPVWKVHRCAAGRSADCTAPRASCAALPRNFGHGLRGSSGTSYGLRVPFTRRTRGRAATRSVPRRSSQARVSRAFSRTRPGMPGQPDQTARTTVPRLVAFSVAGTAAQTGSMATAPSRTTRISGSPPASDRLARSGKRPSAHGAGCGRRASAGDARQSARSGMRAGDMERRTYRPPASAVNAPALARPRGARQNAAVPREVVLQLPPSPEPPALEGPALLAAAAAAIGLAPDGLAEARLRRVSFDARPRARRWRLVVDVWMRDEEPPPPPATSPPTFAAPRADAPRVVVVGSGPAGLFCALDCVAAGLHVTVLERGRDVQARRRELAATHRGLPSTPTRTTASARAAPAPTPTASSTPAPRIAAASRAVLRDAGARTARRRTILVDCAPARRLEPAAARGAARCASTVRRSGAAVASACGWTRSRPSRTPGAAPSRRRSRATWTPTPAARAVRRRRAGGRPLGARRLRMARARGRAPRGEGLRHRCARRAPAALHRPSCSTARRRPPASCRRRSTSWRRSADERGVYSFCMCPGGFIVPAATEPDGVVRQRHEPVASRLAVRQRRRRRPARAARLVRQSRGDLGLGALTREPLPDAPADDPLFGVRLQLALEERAAVLGGGGDRAPCQRGDRFVEAPGALPRRCRRATGRGWWRPIWRPRCHWG